MPTERICMDFSTIIGQEDIIASLESSIAEKRVGHAYIFSGPRGVGKKTVARAFASALLCDRPDFGKSCGECLQCRMFASGSNPDYREIDSEGASIGVDSIREVQSDVVIRPAYSQRKVYLIIDAERMTVQAQNSLLKTLEEPPEYAVIMLTTSNYGALIDTVRSRAVKYALKNNTADEVREVLLSKYGSNLKSVDFITAYSGGIIGTALELAGSDEFISMREKTLEIILKLSKPGLAEIFDLYKFFEHNKDYVDTILDIMVLFYRDLLLMKKAAGENMLINSDKKDIILDSISNFSSEKLIKNIETVEIARRNIKQNANYQLSIEVMLMKLKEEYS